MADNLWTRFLRLNFISVLRERMFRSFFAFPPHVLTHFKSAFSALKSYLTHHFRMWYFISSFHQAIIFTIPTLLNFLQLKYQGKDKNPFESHPNAMGIAVATSFIYYLAYSAQQTDILRRLSTSYVVFVKHFMLLSGNMSVASLASVLLPDSFGPFVYAFCILISASEFLHWLYQKNIFDYEYISGRIYSYRRHARRFLNKFRMQLVAILSAAAQSDRLLPM